MKGPVQEMVSSEWLGEAEVKTDAVWVCRILPAKVFGLNPAEMIENPTGLLGKELKEGKCMCVCAFVCVFVHFWERPSNICMIL